MSYPDHMIVGYQAIYHATNGPIVNGLSLYRAGDLAEVIQEKEIEYCCPLMKMVWNQGHIGFGYNPEDVDKNKLPEVVLRVERPFPSPRHIVIAYCPFCSKPIE